MPIKTMLCHLTVMVTDHIFDGLKICFKDLGLQGIVQEFWRLQFTADVLAAIDQAFIEMGKWENARLMEKNGVEPSLITFNTIFLNGFYRDGEFGLALKLCEKSIGSNCHVSAGIVQVVVDGLDLRFWLFLATSSVVKSTVQIREIKRFCLYKMSTKTTRNHQYSFFMRSIAYYALCISDTLFRSSLNKERLTLWKDADHQALTETDNVKRPLWHEYEDHRPRNYNRAGGKGAGAAGVIAWDMAGKAVATNFRTFKVKSAEEAEFFAAETAINLAASFQASCYLIEADRDQCSCKSYLRCKYELAAGNNSDCNQIS
ncbi:hypothetical protein IFM89_010731 [Coptis chinensis]|uniref:Uncharacterized protein n=1 Tax=Coptis chinensis TaxID=261450 RepID=A0A835MDT2_9MAGN|nr:hypothetical protein IFM89_010731 [Coptis chinensis]